MLDFSQTFEKYEILVAEVDKVFEAMREDHKACVRCDVGCCDCCHAVFDVTLVESAYINYHFNQLKSRKDRRAVVKRAEKVDRKYYQIKRKLQKMYVDKGMSPEEIFIKLAQERVPCPFLNDDKQCDLYEHRPITCRVYGIPTSIGGNAHICEKAEFKEGTSYPTINLDKINDRLFQLSMELLQEVKAKNLKLHMSLVPPSASILMDFDRNFFDNSLQENT
jgi:Fe-S-cluster containining protein